MKTASRLIPLLLLVAVTLYSCVSLEPVQIKGLNNLAFGEKSSDGATLIIGVALYNPNNVRIKVKKADLDAMINGRSLGRLRIDKTAVLNKQTEETVQFEVKVKGKDLLSGGAGALLSSILTQRADLQLKGKIRVKAYGIGRNLPVDLKQQVKIPSLF